MFTSVLKGMMKDMGEQPVEEIHRVKSGRDLSAEFLSLWSWGASFSQYVDVFTHLGGDICIFCSSVHLLMDTWVVSTSLLL